MITGFNTDIEYGGVVYHVQTEDKGLETPLILSLVYTGGTILASKRSPYEDLIASGFSDEALSERLTRQHRLICAAIHAGRIEDLKRMTASSAVKGNHAPIANKGQPQLELEIVRGNEEREALEEARLTLEAEKQLEALTAKERESLQAMESTEEIVLPPLVEIPLPPPRIPAAPAPYSVHDQRRRALVGDPEGEDGLRIRILGERPFRSGETATLEVLVAFRTGNQEQPIAKAAVSVKVLGTTFRPQLYSAKTQSDGIAVIAAQIPRFTSGRAAILVRAVAAGTETELRRVILPG